MLIEEKTIHSEMIFQGKMINLRVDTVQLPDEKVATREIIEHPGAVAIIPITSDNKIIMVRQYRKPVEDFLLEIPAGKLEYNEKTELCARRELEEETGYSAERMEYLFSFYSTPGFSNEIMHLFIAQKLIQGETKPDEDEYLSIECYSLNELLEMIFNGRIKDSKTIIGILAAKEHLTKMIMVDK